MNYLSLAPAFRLLRRAVPVLAAALLLSACGGGGGGRSGVEGEVPPPMFGDVPDNPDDYSPSWNAHLVPGTPAQEYNAQWGLQAVNADAAYAGGWYGQGVTVAVVDTGVFPNHPDLTDNLVQGIRVDGPGSFTSTISDPNGHGTHMAGIIGASRNNIGMHGVAPSVSILPIQNGFYQETPGDWGTAFRYAATNNVVAVNNSWGWGDERVAGVYTTDALTATIMFTMPLIAPLIEQRPMLLNEINQMDSALSGGDMVAVFAAGNSFWHEGEVQFYCDIGEGSLPDGRCQGEGSNMLPVESLVTAFVSQSVEVFIEDIAETITTSAYGDFAAMHVDPNSAADFSLAPYFDDDLVGRFAAVVALERIGSNLQLANFSNGCGTVAMYWCIAAPGVDINSTQSNVDQDGQYTPTPTVSYSGTSQAAPHVVGGLAVLKSRLGSMPMSVVLTILLTTATDMGDAGIDPLYGHGLMNLDTAIAAQNDVELMLPHESALGAVRVFDTMAPVSPPLQGLAQRLRQVSVAVRYAPDQYYNMPLGDLLESDAPVQYAAPALGAAAADMLTPVATREVDLLPRLHAVQDVSDGRLLRLAYAGDALRLRYDLCGSCEASVWEQFSLSENAAPPLPFYVRDGMSAQQSSEAGEQQRAGGEWLLTPNWRLFGDVGLGGWNDESVDADEMRYRQWGLRWRGAALTERVNLLAEYSQLHESDTLLGNALSGGLEMDGAVTRAARLAAQYDLGGDKTLYADYEAGRGTADGEGLLTKISYRYHTWRVGAAATLRDGSTMRLGMRHNSGIHDGRATVAAGALVDGALEYGQQSIAWSGDALTTLHWGLHTEMAKNIGIGFGLEHGQRGKKRYDSASAELRWRF